MVWYGERHDGGENPYIGPLDRPDLIPQVLDVQGVVLEDPDLGHRTETSPEGYWLYRDGEWFGADAMGWWGYQHTPGLPKHSLFGRTLRQDDWGPLLKAITTHGFPPKSATTRREQGQTRG